MKRAMVPPKLQMIADRRPTKSRCARRAPKPACGVCRRDVSFGRLTHDAYAANWSLPESVRQPILSALFNSVVSGVVQPRNPVVAIALQFRGQFVGIGVQEPQTQNHTRIQQLADVTLIRNSFGALLRCDTNFDSPTLGGRAMKAAWYERNGAAQSVLTVGEMATSEPGPGEVRVKIAASGVNPSDVKSRRGRPLLAAHHPAQRRRRRDRRGRRRRRPPPHRRARLAVECPVEAAVRHRGGVLRAGGRAGGETARPRRDRGGRLPRHPGAHRHAGGAAARPDRRQDLARHRRRLSGRPLRRRRSPKRAAPA